MEKRKLSYLWLIPLTLIFPMLQNIIFFIRFANLSVDLGVSSLIFAPMGLISGLLLIYFLRKDIDYKRKKRVFIGYIISAPFAILLSIMSGLLVPPIIATTVFGTVPLVVGILLGCSIGRSSKVT